MRLFPNIPEGHEKAINLVAAFITIFTAPSNIGAFFAYTADASPPFLNHAPSFPLGIVAFLFLESVLAISFGWLIGWLVVLKRPGVLLSLCVMVLSAAVSVFNVKWLLLGHEVDGLADRLILTTASVFSCWMACYLIGWHVQMRKAESAGFNHYLRNLNNNRCLYIGQMAAFGLMYAAALAGVV